MKIGNLSKLYSLTGHFEISVFEILRVGLKPSIAGPSCSKHR